MRERGEPLVLLDVRESGELALSALGGEKHIPLAMLPLRVGELDPAQTHVVICHHGTRSGLAVRWLREHGFEKLHNLAGGIDAYAREADPTVPRY